MIVYDEDLNVVGCERRDVMDPELFDKLLQSMKEADEMVRRPLPLDENWMRVAPGTDAAIWRPWSRETGEL